MGFQRSVDLVGATRDPAAAGLAELVPLVQYGASPRATIWLALASRAHAFLSRRGYVTPADIKAVAPEVMRHRVMPKNSTKAKMDAVVDYGGEVIVCEPNDEARTAACNSIIEKTGATLVHPFNDYNIIAGQATAAKELIEQTNDLDAIEAHIRGHIAK